MAKPKLSELQQKDWERMTDMEREAAFEELDRLGPRLDEIARPLGKRERDKLAALPTKAAYQRGRGRPKLGGVGAKHVNVTIDPALLAQADATAKQKGMSRSALFSLAVERFIKASA